MFSEVQAPYVTVGAVKRRVVVIAMKRRQIQLSSTGQTICQTINQSNLLGFRFRRIL